MKVQAESEAGLAIRFGTGSWGTTASAGMDKADVAAQKLKPASTATSKVWSHASAELASASAAKNDTRKTLETSEYPAHFLVKDFQIRSTSASAKVKGLYVKSVSVTGITNDTMNTALRVGIAYNVADNSAFATANTAANVDKFVIFAPVVTASTEQNANNNPSYNYTFYANKDDTTGTPVTALAAEAGTKDNALLISGDVAIPDAAASCINVKVYVWYEGEDQNLYSDNYVTKELSVSVNFSNIGTVTPA